MGLQAGIKGESLRAAVGGGRRTGKVSIITDYFGLGFGRETVSIIRDDFWVGLETT